MVQVEQNIWANAAIAILGENRQLALELLPAAAHQHFQQVEIPSDSNLHLEDYKQVIYLVDYSEPEWHYDFLTVICAVKDKAHLHLVEFGEHVCSFEQKFIIDILKRNHEINDENFVHIVSGHNLFSADVDSQYRTKLKNYLLSFCQ